MEMVLFPMNLVFALESGDIGFASGGLFPKRKHGVVQGVYTKLGNRIENRWEGFISNKHIPYVVNPDKGYIVSCNNFNGSDRSTYGVSHAFAFIHRKIRISEMIEELINSGKKLNIKDMQDITFDVLDL